MLVNLFVVFDPVSFLGLSINWVIMVIAMGFVFLCFSFYFYSNLSVFYLMLKEYLSGVFSEISGGFYLGLVYMGFCFFLCLMFTNVVGLFPFVFTLFSHPLVTLSLGLVMWASFVLLGWTKNFVFSSAHLVPYGSPLILAPFMVVIESVSHIIRPFTLSIRLAANMMAGHLIMGLLASLSLEGGKGFVLSVSLQTLLMILEFGVCVIQSFVFSVLMMLYVVEYY